MLKSSKVMDGEFLSWTTYVKVLNADPNQLTVVNMENGQEFSIRGKELIESMNSAAQFEETRKCSKHELVIALQNAKDKVFTASFTKQNGEERVLTGHLISFDGMLGRTQVRDLEIPSSDPTKGLRLIDNRSLSWLVLDGVKYIAQ